MPARPLHVGLNLQFLHARAGGTLTYARELIAGLLAAEPQTRVTCFATREAPREDVERDWGGDVRWLRLPGGVTGGPPWNAATSLIAQWAREPVLARRQRLDVLHGLAGAVAPLSPVPTVATVLDLVWRHVPGAMSRRDTVGMRVMVAAAARCADRLIAISHAAKADLVDTLRVDPGHVDVTPLGHRTGPMVHRRVPTARAAQPLVLCVAQQRVHKNLEALIRALALVQDLAPPPRLVLVGTPTPHEARLRAAAAEHGVARDVTFAGWVDDLDALYASAACFVLPSRIEGFGLPIVEAMGHGVPVACSDRSSLPEVAGGAALLFDPDDDEAIAGALRRLLTDEALAAELAARGLRRAAELTWEATARATLESYRRAIADGARAAV